MEDRLSRFKRPASNARFFNDKISRAYPGYEVILVEATIPVGGREGRHTHSGTMVGYLTQGTFTLDNEGTFTDLPVGGSVIVGPGKVHEGINRGKTPIKALVTFIVPKVSHSQQL